MPHFPAPGNDQLELYPTPNLGDILVVEHRDPRAPENKAFKYGDSHPDKVKYPDHKLSYKGDTTDGKMAPYYWVADRKVQEKYNWEIKFAHGGRQAFPRYTRTYLLPRKGYVGGLKGAADPVNTDAILIYEEQGRTGAKEFDNLYVVVTRVYDHLATYAVQREYNFEITYPYSGNKNFPRYTRTFVVNRDNLDDFIENETPLEDPVFQGTSLLSVKVDRFGPNAPEDSCYVLVTVVYDHVPDISNEDDLDDMVKWGFRVEYPYDVTGHPKVIWRFPIDTSSYATDADYSNCPIPGYETLERTEKSEKKGEEAEALGEGVRVYEKLPSTLLEDLEKDDPNRLIPAKFLKNLETLRTKKAVKTGTTPAISEGFQTDPTGVTLDRQVSPRGDSDLVSLQTELNQKATKHILQSQVLDPQTGGLLDISEEVVPHGTPGTEPDANGVYTEVRAINAYWSLATTRKASDLVDARTYDTYTNVYWPPVLLTAPVFSIVNYTNGNPAKIIVDWRMKQAYNGPTKTTIEEQWFQNKPTVSNLIHLRPEGINYQGVMMSFGIPACLHGEITITENTGSDHPTYAPTVVNRTFDATNEVDWPTSYLKMERIEPYKMGWLRQQVTVHAPQIS